MKRFFVIILIALSFSLSFLTAAWGSGCTSSGPINTATSSAQCNNTSLVDFKVTNSGSISVASGIAFENRSPGVITTFENQGNITALSGGTAVSNGSNAQIATFLNAGQIIGDIDGIYNGGNISSLINSSSGIITGNNNYSINNDVSAVISSLVNFGTISSPFFSNGPLTNSGEITQFTNVGIINGVIQNNTATDGSGNPIPGTGVIGTLNNLQGGSTPLALNGNLPNNYNIIINSKTSYGQFLISAASGGPMAFGIYAGGVADVAASTLAVNTYLDVLEGVDASFLLASSLHGIYGSYAYSLVPETVGGSIWDLVVTATPTNMLAGGTYYLSGVVEGSVNPVFAGGTLALLNNDYSSQSFTVTAPGGIVTSPTGGSATLSGVFSGPGAMIFNGTGTTYMNGVNTYTGGTTVASGTLSVGSSEANNTARLAGDVTVQAAGTLAGHGGIGGNVTNSGRVAPGGSIGTLSVAGNYAQTAGGTLSTSITPTANSVLAVAGTANIAGGFAIDASSGAYSKRTYTVLTSSGLTGKFSSLTGNLASYSTLNSSLSYDLNNAYLTLSAGTVDTQQSLVNTAAVLQGIYTLQNSVLANSFAYDCNVFGANDVCVSVGGRNTAVQAEGINNTSGLLIAAYRPHANYRIGAYADQNLSTNSPGGTVKLGNNTPLIGFFGAWNERLDGTGTEVKVSAAYGQKNATVTRSVVGTSDPGAGSSNLISQGAQIQAKYGFAVLSEVIVSPYVGMRYTQNNMGGYTEGTSSTVTAPLTYSALNTNATTALAGLGASYRFIPKATVYASAGVETDTNTSNSTYSATGVTGLTPINFNANPVKTRPTATIGAYYDVEKNQRVGINGIYRQEPFQAVSTTTVMATYTIGM